MADEDEADWGLDADKVQELRERATAANDDEPDPVEPGGNPLQCPECGDIQVSALTLGAHRYRAHGVKGSGSKKKAPSGPRAAPRVPRRSTARKPTRKDTYQAGLAFVFTGATMVRVFDEWDYNHSIRCAPIVADGLAAWAEINDTVRKAADMILAGTVAHPGAATILAALGLAVPILAHHGLAPQPLANAFLPFVGEPPPTAPAPSANGSKPPPLTADEAMVELNTRMAEFMAGLPLNVQADLASRMMSGQAPTMAGGI